MSEPSVVMRRPIGPPPLALRFAAVLVVPLLLYVLVATGQKAVDNYRLNRDADALRTERRGKRKQLLSVRADRGPNTVRVIFTNVRSVHRGMHIGHSLFSRVVIRPTIFVGNGAQNFIEQTAATIAIRHDHSALTGIEIGYQDARESFILSGVTEVRNLFLSTQPQAQAIAT